MLHCPMPVSRQALPPSPPLTAWALLPYPLSARGLGPPRFGDILVAIWGVVPLCLGPLSSHRGCPGLCLWGSQPLCKLTGFVAQLGSQRREFQPGTASTVSCEMWVLCGPVPGTLVSARLELLSPVGTWPSLAGGQARLLAFENLRGLAHGKKRFLSRPPTRVSLPEALRARPCVQPSGLGACPHRVVGQPPLLSFSTGSLPLWAQLKPLGPWPPVAGGRAVQMTPDRQNQAAAGAPHLGTDRAEPVCLGSIRSKSGTEVSRPSICLGSRTPAVTPSVSLL